MQADPTIDWHEKYERLRVAVLDTLDTQQKFFKTRDPNILRTSKAKEKALREMINPPQQKISQAEINWLGQ